MSAEVVGIGLSFAEGRAGYVPIRHPPLEMRPVLPFATVAEALRPLLEDPAVEKISARGKLDHILFARAGVATEGLAFDIPLAAFLLNPARRSVSVEELAQEHLTERPRPSGALLEGGALEANLDAAAEAGHETRPARPLPRLPDPARRHGRVLRRRGDP